MNQLNEKTTIPVKTAIGVCIAVASAVWFTATIKKDIEGVQRDVTALTLKMDAIEKPTPLMDRWTATDQRAWSKALGESNPTLKVPIAEKAR